MGKPVVTTPLQELQEYRGGGLVYWAETTEEFVTALDRAVAERSEETADARRQVALNSSWSARAEQILNVIAGALK